MFLIDTNVLSEVRKPKPEPRVVEWLKHAGERDLYLSVITLGELQRGVLLKERKDPNQGLPLRAWLMRINSKYSARILPVTQQVAMLWASLNVPHPLPALDGLIAATALVHGLTLVTRNVTDFAGTGVLLLNPWEAR